MPIFCHLKCVEFLPLSIAETDHCPTFAPAPHPAVSAVISMKFAGLGVVSTAGSTITLADLPIMLRVVGAIVVPLLSFADLMVQGPEGPLKE